MKTRTTLVAVVLGVAALSAVIWWVRFTDAVPTDRIDVAGNVRDEIRTVSAPALVYPTPDYSVGIPSNKPATRPSGGAAASSRSAVGAAGPRVAGRLATVTVMQGDRVAAGQTLAVLDTSLLDLGIQQAKGAEARSKADVGLLGDTLDTLAENEDKLADARGELASGRHQLLVTQAQLRQTRADLASARRKAAAGRTAIKAQIAQANKLPDSPQKQQMLAALKRKLAEVNAGIAKMDAGLAKMDAGLAKIASALAKMPSAARQLSTAKSSLSDAKTQVKAARSTLQIVADAAGIAVDLAQARLDAATITAPEAGVVTFARAAGTVVMVGAPVVRIRPDGPLLVDTYLTAEQVARVALDTPVEVRSDSETDRVFSARIVRIGTKSEFPPTNFPTDIVHMTRAVRVTASLDGGATLPAGTPVDLTIRTN